MGWTCQGCGDTFATTLHYQVAQTCKACFRALSTEEQAALSTRAPGVARGVDADVSQARASNRVAHGRRHQAWYALHLTSRLLVVAATTLLAWGVVLTLVGWSTFVAADVDRSLRSLIVSFSPLFDALFRAAVLVVGIGLIETLRVRRPASA